MTYVGDELLALDIGEARCGVARANSLVKIPEPLAMIQGPTAKLSLFHNRVRQIADENGSKRLIVGLPKSIRGGDDSSQAAKIRVLAKDLAEAIDLPLTLVDEALSTIEADKWRERYPHASEDSLAACIILERYFQEHA